MLKFYCLITGDDYQTLKSETIASRKKVAILASLIFIPVIFWFINGFLLVRYVLDGSVQSALLTASIAAVVIFIIERSIVMMIDNTFLMLIRILLGLIIAVLGSICLDEVIFENDIRQQLIKNKESDIQHVVGENMSMNAAQTERLQKIVDEKHKTWKDALAAAGREADGTGGSGIRGVSSIAKLKIEQAKILENDYNLARVSLDEHNEQLENQTQKLRNEIEASFANQALLQNIKALFQVINSDIWMLVIFCFFTGLMILMESMVVLIKLLSRKTNYEKKVLLIEELGDKKIKSLKNHNPIAVDPGQFHPSYKESKKMLKAAKDMSMYN